MTIFAFLESGLGAQTRLSAADAFSAIAGTLADSPLTTREQFCEIEPQLKHIGFVQLDSIAWRYINAGDIVIVQAYPNAGHFYVELLPSNVRPTGDATLAALIAKASTVFFNDGDSIELLMSERHSTKQGRSLSDFVYLHFKLSGGTWWKTSRTIEWSK